MKIILTPNPNPPSNLRQIVPAYGGREFTDTSEDEMIALTITRNKETGLIPAETDSERDALIAAQTIPITLPPVGAHWIVEESSLPGGSLAASVELFFDAWMWDTDKPAVDMTKARPIHLAEIRRVRNLELAKEDINMLKAIEAGDTAEQDTVKARKQTLRDLPATFDITTDAGTPALLKTKWPSELPARE